MHEVTECLSREHTKGWRHAVSCELETCGELETCTGLETRGELDTRGKLDPQGEPETRGDMWRANC